MITTRLVSLIVTSLLALTANVAAGQAQPKNTVPEGKGGSEKVGIVAHRGFHKYDGSAENSIYAMQLAVDHDFYGTEFDMQLTADNVPVVFHDPHLQGMAIGETHHAEIMEHPAARLSNGEMMPTLSLFLESYAKAVEEQQHRGRQTRLFFEIKPPSQPEKVDVATSIVKEYVTRHHLENQVCFISFSLDVCRQLASLMPEADVAYLGGDRSPRELKEMGLSGIDYHYRVLLEHPDWVDEAHQLGMTVNAWTVNEVDIARQLIELGVDFVTTDLPLEMSELVQQ